MSLLPLLPQQDLTIKILSLPLHVCRSTWRSNEHHFRALIHVLCVAVLATVVGWHFTVEAGAQPASKKWGWCVARQAPSCLCNAAHCPTAAMPLQSYLPLENLLKRMLHQEMATAGA